MLWDPLLKRRLLRALNLRGTAGDHPDIPVVATIPGELLFDNVSQGRLVDGSSTLWFYAARGSAVNPVPGQFSAFGIELGGKATFAGLSDRVFNVELLYLRASANGNIDSIIRMYNRSPRTSASALRNLASLETHPDFGVTEVGEHYVADPDAGMGTRTMLIGVPQNTSFVYDAISTNGVPLVSHQIKGGARAGISGDGSFDIRVWTRVVNVAIEAAITAVWRLTELT